MHLAIARGKSQRRRCLLILHCTWASKPRLWQKHTGPRWAKGLFVSHKRFGFEPAPFSRQNLTLSTPLGGWCPNLRRREACKYWKICQGFMYVITISRDPCFKTSYEVFAIAKNGDWRHLAWETLRLNWCYKTLTILKLSVQPAAMGAIC